jgi:hypothetical protein
LVKPGPQLQKKSAPAIGAHQGSGAAGPAIAGDNGKNNSTTDRKNRKLNLIKGRAIHLLMGGRKIH